MLKPLSILVATALLGAALPVQAQDQALPLLRVYIDAPYFYDFLAEVGPTDADGRYPLRLYIEGKEVGEAKVLYDCDTHSGKQTPVTEWSGAAGDFVAAALLSFDHLYCGS